MFWKRRRSHTDFRAEIQSHIDIETDRLIADGFSPAEARSAVLSIVSGIVGIGLARAGVQSLLTAYPTSLPRASEVSINAPVLIWTFVISLATSMLFGVAPLM